MSKRSNLLFALLIASLRLSAAEAQIWDLNDVTYLFPLPTPATLVTAIRAHDLDIAGSPLISIDLIEPLVQIQNAPPGSSPFRPEQLRPGDILPRSKDFESYKDLFMVALRMDPCFRDQFSDKCRKQIRAVWQPVDHWREGSPESVDAAIHTFYDLSDKEFGTLLRDLQSLKSAEKVETAGLPLGIHPGFSGIKPTAFQRSFRALILPYIGATRIRRLARVTLEVSSAGWDLSSRDFLANGKTRTVAIFPGDVTRQQTFNIAGFHTLGSNGMPTTGQMPEDFAKVAAEIESRKIYEPAGRAFSGVVITESKLPTRGDQILDVFRSSQHTIDSGIAGRASAFRRATRIENPAHHLPGTIDCVSCHIATSVKTLSGTPAQIALSTPHFEGHYDLRNLSRYYGDSHNMRMLGYMYENLQLSDRVIFESAAVADALNRLSR
jgi:hypothetical protein